MPRDAGTPPRRPHPRSGTGGDDADDGIISIDPLGEEPDALIGRTLGHCRLESRIAEGGMGAVYRGVQLATGRPVAVKVMHRNPLTRDRQPLERFFREARTAAEIDHPNVVRVYEAGLENELAYMVMELVEGQNLKDAVRRQGTLHPLRALEVMMDAARGLGAAHERGMVHRDVKPANLLIDPSGTTKLADFGLVRGKGDATLTRTGLIVGTPDYMSPESCRGEAVGPSADLYALGGTFYFALVGQPPFGAAHDDVPSLLLKHAYHPPPDPRALREEIPPAIAVLVQSLLAKRPEGRPRDAADLVARLEALREVARRSPEPSRSTATTLAVDLDAIDAGAESVPETMGGHAPSFAHPPAAAADGGWVGGSHLPGDLPAGPRAAALPGGLGAPTVDDRHETRVLPRIPDDDRAGRPRSPGPGPGPAPRAGSARWPARRGNDAAEQGSRGSLSAQELLVRGRLHLGARRFRAAADDFRHAARIDPQAAPAWLGLARALALLPSEQRDALEALERAIARGVRDPAMIRRAVEGTALEEDQRLGELLRSLAV